MGEINTGSTSKRFLRFALGSPTFSIKLAVYLRKQVFYLQKGDPVSIKLVKCFYRTDKLPRGYYGRLYVKTPPKRALFWAEGTAKGRDLTILSKQKGRKYGNLASLKNGSLKYSKQKHWQFDSY